MTSASYVFFFVTIVILLSLSLVSCRDTTLPSFVISEDITQEPSKPILNDNLDSETETTITTTTTSFESDDFLFYADPGVRASIKDCSSNHEFHNALMQDCRQVCSVTERDGGIACKNIYKMRLLFCLCPRNKIDRMSCTRASKSSPANQCDTRTAFANSQCSTACQMQGYVAFVCPPKMSRGPFPLFCVCGI